MTFLRIRQAELALAADRLDEALGLLNRPEVRAHRRGQELVTRLADALLCRAKRCIAANRTADALAELARLTSLVGARPDIAELKAQATGAMLESQHRHRQSAEVVARAKSCLNRGRLGEAERLMHLGEFSAGGLQVIMHDLNEQQQRVDAHCDAADAALARHDDETAVAELLAARALDADDPRIAERIASIHQDLVRQARESFVVGRIDTAALIEKKLQRIAAAAIDVQQLRQDVAQLRGAWDAIERGRFRSAEESLRRLATATPDASWLRQAIEHVAAAAAAVEAVRSGPLGLLHSAAAETLPPPATSPRSPARPAVHRPLHSIDSLTEPGGKFMVQVDGAGSFFVARGAATTVGPLSASGRVNVGLVCEASTPTIQIRRIEDDYFLQAVAADATAGAKLLTPGERISLSPRCRLTFQLPVPASTTAVIELSGARHPRGDVRRVILMDRDIVIGPGGASHIRCDSLNEPIVLFHRDGQLHLRGAAGVTMGGAPIDENMPLQLNQPIRGASFGLVLTPA